MAGKELLRRFVAGLGDYWYNTISYYYLHLRSGALPSLLRWRSPKSLNDKIIFLKTRYRYPQAHTYADKLLVRDYVASVAGDKYLVPLLGVYGSSAEINYDTLPDKFVLKANHGSAMNIICHDKQTLPFGEVGQVLDGWLKINYYEIGREYQYKDIAPKLFAEQMIIAEDGGEVKDYKVFCVHGRPKFVQVDVDRHTNHTRSYYDIDWNRLPFTILYPAYGGEVEKPRKLSEMLWLADRLANPFVFARVDLYAEGDRIYFGEITLHHGGGFEPILPREYARSLGNLIDLGALSR